MSAIQSQMTGESHTAIKSYLQHCKNVQQIFDGHFQVFDPRFRAQNLIEGFREI